MQYVLFGAVAHPDPHSNSLPELRSGTNSNTSSRASLGTRSASIAALEPTSGLQTVAVDAQLKVGSDWRHFSWQIPTMMLGNSIVFTLTALAIAIFDEARKAVGWRTPEMVTAICVAVSITLSVTCYFISWICVEWQMQEAIAKTDL
jgi:hypothetical protein